LTRNLKLTLEYDGTDFEGWQRQPAPARTVQQVVEDAIEEMTGVFSCLHGAGRTDSGVHARGQVANFRTGATIPLTGFLRGLNAILRQDAAVTDIEEVDERFDARHSAKGKRYVYRVWNGRTRSPLVDRFAWHRYHPLDLTAMREAAASLLGEHDFSAFRASDCSRKNPIRTVRKLEIEEARPGLVEIGIEATAFLKNMVRVIAGTLIEVGLGDRPPAEVAEILASGDRARAGKTAPARGLTLERVDYDDAPQRRL
jgi:tRNA pseudouridine38-40 synthase